jgi:hypothetical protein
MNKRYPPKLATASEGFISLDYCYQFHIGQLIVDFRTGEGNRSSHHNYSALVTETSNPRPAQSMFSRLFTSWRVGVGVVGGWGGVGGVVGCGGGWGGGGVGGGGLFLMTYRKWYWQYPPGNGAIMEIPIFGQPGNNKTTSHIWHSVRWSNLGGCAAYLTSYHQQPADFFHT